MVTDPGTVTCMSILHGLVSPSLPFLTDRAPTLSSTPHFWYGLKHIVNFWNILWQDIRKRGHTKSLNLILILLASFSSAKYFTGAASKEKNNLWCEVPFISKPVYCAVQQHSWEVDGRESEAMWGWNSTNQVTCLPRGSEQVTYPAKP